MKTLRELLIEICTATEDQRIIFNEEGDEFLEKTLRGLPIVWKGDEDQRRWRIDYRIVCKIVDDGFERFFKYSSCKGTNENSWEDAGYIFEGIDNVKEVFPKEIVSVIYSAKE